MAFDGRLFSRVTKKGDMRTWSNARGEGRLFNIDLLDEQGSEIKGTFFKEDADKWINVVQEGQVWPGTHTHVFMVSYCFSCLCCI